MIGSGPRFRRRRLSILLSSICLVPVLALYDALMPTAKSSATRLYEPNAEVEVALQRRANAERARRAAAERLRELRARRGSARRKRAAPVALSRPKD